MISIFVAYSKNRVIGKANDLPWYIPADLKRFKELTTGHTVIMGKNTCQSIVSRLGHALPNRRNIVISTSLKNAPKGFKVTRSLEEALQAAKKDKTQESFFIGGERVYHDSLQAGIIDRIYATEIDKVIEGDVYFPKINKSEWQEVNRENHHNDNYKYSFVVLERKKMKNYNTKVARSDAQLEKMDELIKRGICIFCPEHIHEDSEKIQIKTKHWMVKKNAYPYERTKLHILLISRVHVSTMSQLSKAAQMEFTQLIVRCEKQFKLVSYALGMRAGDMRCNGASMEHLHAHIVVGDTGDPNHEPVRFKMSSRPD